LSHKTDFAIFLLIFQFFYDIMSFREEVCNAMQGNKPVQTYNASILQKIHFVGAGVGVMRLPAPPKLQLSKINILAGNSPAENRGFFLFYMVNYTK
jgi:hypothetical protein